MLDFNKVVKILGKKGGKVIFKHDIFEIVDPEMKSQYAQFVNKTIYRLKAEGYIIPLKSGVYIIPDDHDAQLNAIDLIEKYYLKLLKKYITHNVGSGYYISGIKSLEFHMKNFSIPEKIYVINRSLSKKIMVGNYEIYFKTLSGKYQGKKINLFQKFSVYSKDIFVGNTHLKISGLELSLFESALISDSYEGLDISLITKALKKYGSILNTETFKEIGKYKYNMSVNRLKEITRHSHPELSKVFLEIIKKNGGCFVGEGLRGI